MIALVSAAEVVIRAVPNGIAITAVKVQALGAQAGAVDIYWIGTRMPVDLRETAGVRRHLHRRVLIIAGLFTANTPVRRKGTKALGP